MGIAGLLPQLRSITERRHISEYRGQRVAVDTYSWLHRGAMTCARELVESLPTDRFIVYCMEWIKMLRAHGVIPVLVLDGGYLPIKGLTETDRARRRHEALHKARMHMQQGNTMAAHEYYTRAIDITPDMARGLIEALRKASVEYVVAPYEADAQMAYLCRTRHVAAVITEDSDLLAYGTPRVLFKLDRDTGVCDQIVLERLSMNRELNFIGFTHKMFQEFCILSGCDFTEKIDKIGPKTAWELIKRTRGLVPAIRSMRFSGKYSVPDGFEVAGQQALWTMQHQRVYCCATKSLVFLNPLPQSGLVPEHGVKLPVLKPQASHADAPAPACDFLGPWLPNDVAERIAVGDVDPVTKVPYSDTILYTWPKSISHVATNPTNNTTNNTTNSNSNALQPLTNFFPINNNVTAKRPFKPPTKTVVVNTAVVNTAAGPVASSSMKSRFFDQQPKRPRQDDEEEDDLVDDLFRGKLTTVRTLLGRSTAPTLPTATTADAPSVSFFASQPIQPPSQGQVRRTFRAPRPLQPGQESTMTTKVVTAFDKFLFKQNKS